MTMMIDAPTMPGFRLDYPAENRRFSFSAALPTERLDEKYRPTTLSEVMGQGAAVFAMETFLDAPHSTAFLFEGESGVGKTSTARALANDLGVDPDWGFDFIESARGDMEAVERALTMLRHVAPGSGWKLVLVDEADLMTPRASHLWLSALESLPPKSVVVFTTNRPSHFPDRFLDRCERIVFQSDGRTLRQDAQTLVNQVWKRETGLDDAPDVNDLPNVVDSRGIISFRRAVMALNPLIRAVKRTVPPDAPPPPAIATHLEPPVNVPVATMAPSRPTPTRKRPTTSTKRATAVRDNPTTVVADPMVMHFPATNLAERRIASAEATRQRLESESELNAERIRRAREMVYRFGTTATPDMRAELKAAEREDARLVKAWLDAGRELTRANRELERLGG